MKVGKTGIEAGHSNSTSSVTILSLSACTLLLLDGVDKITKVKDGDCGSDYCGLWGAKCEAQHRYKQHQGDGQSTLLFGARVYVG